MSGADTNPGLYPGNPSLPPEVRDKILSTFRHTLNLYKDGKFDDCLIGCDFILKMDPRFGPARKLLEKSKNPSADVDVAELEALVAGTLTRQERVVAAEPDRLLVRAVESYNARDFDAAAAAAEQVLAVLPGNQDAVEILGKARRKKAAQPQAEAAKQKAIAALQANRMEDARRELDRMKALDPDHPAVALLEPKIAAARPAPASPGQPFGESSEPLIAFDDHATMAISADDTDFTEPPRPPKAAAPPPDSLDGLSLDTLSLDTPPPASEVAPPPLAKAPSFAKPSSFAKASEDRSKGGPAAAPAAPPGSPADMWGESSTGGIELEPLAGATPAEKPHPLPGVEPSFDLEGSSSDAPAAPPPLQSIQETESSTSEDEIANILKQGDEAAAHGDRQQAIEIWSRIFLIDISNSDAVIRIEKARQGMAEGNRKIADCLKSGREAFEAGDFTLAREKFLQVHEVEQNEPTAKFYLDRIEEELSAPKPAGGGGAAEKAASPTEEAAAVPAQAARTLQLPFPPKILLAAAGFIVLAGVAIYLGVIRQPGPKAAAPTVAASKAYIDDANTLVRDGKVQEAIAVLEKIPLTDAEYPRAKKLIEQFTKRLAFPPPVGGQATSAPGVSDSGTAAGVAAGGPAAGPNAPPEPAQLRAVAEKAFTEKRYIDALKNFNLAQSTYRGDPTFSQSMGSAAEKVAELTPALKLFNEGEYDTAIPVLWRILHEDHDNQDARSYLLRCYYNQGISQLQNGLFPKALQSFNEVLALDPKDTEAQRHKKFAERYQKVDLDLMGRIYVRHLPHRP
jgi:tetratricopeptide (TPR) repeat protein